MDDGRRTVHGDRVYDGNSADLILGVLVPPFDEALQAVDTGGLVAQKDPGVDHVLCTLRPAELEHLCRPLHLLLLPRPPLLKPIRHGGEIGLPPGKGFFPGLNFIPRGLDLIPELIRSLDDLRGAIFGHHLLGA